MDVVDERGLTCAVVTTEEALHTDWATRRGQFDLVRVVDPDQASWPALRDAGFTVHPAWVTWMTAVGPSEEAFLDGLSGKERRSVRAGQRYAAANGIRMKVVTPLDPGSFDEFLTLYEPQVAAMRHGVPFARMEREDILDQGVDYLAVQAYDDDGLVGGCVCRIRADISTVVIRFASTAPDSRQQRIVRAMYMRVFQTARELGQRNVSLGTDPALYGHMTRPGLFAFKSGLRFTPIPARLFATMDDPDEATRVLRLDALNDPSLLIGYHGTTGPVTERTPLRLDVLSAAESADVAPYRAPFLAEVAARRVG